MEESRSRGLKDIFSDDEDMEGETRHRQPEKQPFASEFDDFIEEDQFSDEEQNQEEDRRRRQISKRPRGPSALASKYRGLDEDKLQELFEVFGDGTEYEWALEGEDLLEQGLNYSDEEVERAGPNLKDVFEPGELKDKLLTDEDNAIRVKDVPERFQLMRANFKDDYLLTEAEFADEERWVLSKLSAEKDSLFFSKPYLLSPFEKAVQKVLEFISREDLEVPFIWHHRKDFLVYSPEDDENDDAEKAGNGPKPASEELLSLDDLWRIVHLDIEYHGIYLKSRAVSKIYDGLVTYDAIYSELSTTSSSLVDYQDLMDYLQFKYSGRIKDQQASTTSHNSTDSLKRRSRFARFERLREGPVYSLVNDFGINSEKVGENIATSTRLYFAEDHPMSPLALAEEYLYKNSSDLSFSLYTTPQQVLDDAQNMLVEEFFHDPRFRKSLRERFWEKAKVDIILTEKGRKQIDEGSPYNDIKYAINRSFEELRLRPQVYLRMLQAESEGLVIVRISYPRYKETLFEELFTRYIASDNVSNISKQWNEVRREVFKFTSRRIIPHICNTIKEDLRVECARSLYYEVRSSFSKCLDQAPYQPHGYTPGAIPRILTLSWGMGEMGKDAILAAVLDEYGEVLEFAKFDDPRDEKFKNQFVDLVNRRVPDIIGIAGFTVPSNRLFQIVDDIIKKEELTAGSDMDSTSPLKIIWIQDEVARIYQNSERASVEFPDQVKLSLYCIGLARYAQSPLLEYAALKKGIKDIRIHPFQDLLSEGELEDAIETVFVDFVNVVGVDVNEAVRTPYLANLLPYVAGLGPRKASSMLQGIQNHGGSLSNRTELVTNEIAGKTIFMNCSSFIIIPFEEDRPVSYDSVEVLDATRIHPQDYLIARKIAADALELDEEDIEALEGQGGVVASLINAKDTDKLNELILGEYAKELDREYNQKKRETLEMIKDELQHRYFEMRKPFHILTEMEVFTMLTQETKETLHNGVVVPVNVRRVGDRFLSGQLSSGIDANVSLANMFDPGDEAPHPSTVFNFGQTVQGVILDISYSKFSAEISTAPSTIKEAQETKRRTQKKDAKHWNVEAEEAERRKMALKKEAEQRTTRIINHPLFKPFNSRQAEEYLATMSNGDVVIRPSSRGYDHIAVTWKVADGIFQHLDVLEMDKPNDFSIGNILQVGTTKYSDLDELVVMHVQSMARKVDQMVNHEKFLKMTRPEVEDWLRTYTKSNPRRSVYAFCYDHKRPGYFSLMYQTGASTPVQTLAVKVVPGGYTLLNHSYPGVNELVNGFKTMMKTQMSELSRQRGPPGGGGSRYDGGYNSGYNNGAPPRGGNGYNTGGMRYPGGMAPGAGRDMRDHRDRDVYAGATRDPRSRDRYYDR